MTLVISEDYRWAWGSKKKGFTFIKKYTTSKITRRVVRQCVYVCVCGGDIGYRCEKIYNGSVYDGIYTARIKTKEVILSIYRLVPAQHVHFLYALSHFRAPWNSHNNLSTYFYIILKTKHAITQFPL